MYHFSSDFLIFFVNLVPLTVSPSYRLRETSLTTIASDLLSDKYNFKISIRNL